LTGNQQLVAAAAALAEHSSPAKPLPLLPPQSPPSNATSPSAVSSSSSSDLALRCVSFSRQVYLQGAGGAVAWARHISDVDAGWVICDASAAAAAVVVVAAAAAAATETAPVSYGGPCCPPLSLPPSLSASSLLLLPLRSSLPLKLQFPTLNSSIVLASSAPSLPPISHSPRITHVACGNWHAVAVDSDGGVWAWGCNADGQVRTPLHLGLCRSA
jgi:hypothetical protein